MYLIAGIGLLSSLFSSPGDMGDSFLSLLSSLLTAAFAVSLLFFSGFHLHLIWTGQSTIEAKLGKRNATQQIQQQQGQQQQQATANANNGQSLVSTVGDDESTRLDIASSPSSSGSAFTSVPYPFSSGSGRSNWDAV